MSITQNPVSYSISGEALATIIEWQHRGQYDLEDSVEFALKVGGQGDWTQQRFNDMCDKLEQMCDDVAARRSGRMPVEELSAPAAIIVEWQHKGCYSELVAIAMAFHFGGPGEWTRERLDYMADRMDAFIAKWKEVH